MIKDNIKKANLYYNLSPNIKAGLKYLENTDFSALPDGKYEITDGVYAIVQSYEPKQLEQGKFESHRKYTDIQFLIEGTEKMGFAPTADFTQETAYDSEKDIVFLTPLKNCEQNFIEVMAGEFVIFTPQDAHMPSIAVKTGTKVRKIVVKALV